MYKKFLTALAATFIAGSVSAATVSSTGDFLEIPTPAEVKNGTPSSNDNILYFNELQGVTLGAALTTDTGTIAAGTRVDSHMFLLNRVSGKSLTALTGTLTFATEILGTMSQTNGGNLVASDFLGGTTTYTNFKNRGLENSGKYADSISLIGTNTISASLYVTQPGDWVRVVTVAAVPVPASILLLPLGLGALGAVRRRRNKTA